MSNGSKTYYDDYVRKQNAMKPSNSVSSMHSDRGAYVNFLEVQLERVSAACLGVHSYDQRFIDMHASLVALEQKYVQSTRLLALSQQCIEVTHVANANFANARVISEGNQLLLQNLRLSLSSKYDRRFDLRLTAR